jgi:hypothetical protein
MGEGPIWTIRVWKLRSQERTLDPREQRLVGRGYRFDDTFLQKAGQPVVSSRASRYSSVLRNGIERIEKGRISLVDVFYQNFNADSADRANICGKSAFLSAISALSALKTTTR